MIIKNISAVFDERHGKVDLKIITDEVSVKGSVDVRECEDMDGLLTVLTDTLTRLRRKVNSKVADKLHRHGEAVYCSIRGRGKDNRTTNGRPYTGGCKHEGY